MRVKLAYLGGGGLAALLALAQGGAALAQTGPTKDQGASRSGPAALAEVVVTARRRAESIEKVPSTISVLTAKNLVQQGVHSESDLQAAVPGLIIRTGNTNEVLNYSIRGESLDQFSGSAPGVQAYVDEVPIASNTPSTFYDMAGVQVLKGPQGTLFGRNSTGGAVLLQTAQPTNAYGGYASLQYGNLGKLITEGAINLPIIQDKMLLRLAADYQQGGAFVHNLYDGRTLGDTDGLSGRATLLLRPVDKLTNVTTAQFGHNYGTPEGFALRYVDPCGSPQGGTTCLYDPSNPDFNQLVTKGPLRFSGGFLPGYPGGHFVYAGGLATLPAFLQTQPRYTVDEPGPWKNKTISAFVGNTTTYELSPSLTIKNIFGYNRVNGGTQYSDATPYGLLAIGGSLNSAGTEAGVNQYSQIIEQVISDELQLQGKAFDNRLTYIVGLFYNDDSNQLDSPVNVNLDFPALGGFYNIPLRYDSISDTKSYAVFSQATYALTDKLNITGGIRGTWTELGQYQAPDSANFGVGDPNPLHATQSNPSWTFSLDYHLTPELMTYVTTRGSWRVGGYTPTGAPLGSTVLTTDGGNYFLPEKTKDVEVGAKFNGRIADVPVQLNVDGYYSWITDVQKTASTDIVVAGTPTETSNTFNIPGSIVRGVEADLQVRPVRWLRLGGVISYADAQFSKESVLLFNVGPFGDLPKYSGSVYADIVVPLRGDTGTLDYHVDFYGQSSFWPTSLGNFNEQHARIPGYGLVNMRLDWSDPIGAKGLTVSGFVKNLGNKLYYTGGSASEVVQSDEPANFGLPRTFGFVLRSEF